MFKEVLHRPGSQSERPTGPSGLWQRLELRLPAGEQAGPLWPRLEERLAAIQDHPRLREDLVLKPVQFGDGPTYLLSDPVGGRHFRLGEREAFILSLLDGQRGIAELAQDCSARFGPILAPAVERFLQDIRLAGLLEERASLWQRLGSLGRSRPAILWTLPASEEKLAGIHDRLRSLFHPLAWAAILVLLAGTTIAVLVVQGSLLRADALFLSSSWWWIPVLLVALYPAMVPVVLTHEMAHALVCIHFGGRVSRLGLMMRHLLPAAFADVSDVWTMPRGARIAIFLAGPASTIVWAAMAVAVWVWTPAGSFVHLLAVAILLASLLSTLTGLNPVAGYDGSEVLAEWLEVPDLHRRALQYNWERLRQRAPQVPPRERRIFAGYGLAFLLYNVAVVALIVAVVLLVLLR